MEESDRQFIAELFLKQEERLEKHLDQRFEQQEKRLDQRFEQQGKRLDQRFEEQEKRLDQRFQEQDARLEQRLDQRFQEQDKEIKHSLDLYMDHVDHKLGILIDGQQMLAERLDRVEHELKQEIGKLDQRVMRVEADLAAHRSDPHAHSGTYVVKEG